MANNSIGVYLPVSVVFPEIKNDFATFKSLLRNLSRTDTLFWCARLNLVISDSTDFDRLSKQQFGVSQLFTTEEINLINDFAKEHGGAQKITVFFRGQLLELIRWVTLLCDDFPNDGETHEQPEVRRRFAQAALIASDIWARRVFKNRFSLDGGIDIARRRALGSVRKSVEATSLPPNLYKALGRGWHLINDYLPHHYKHFQDEFRDSAGLSIEEYYVCLASVMINFMNPKRGSGIFRSDFEGETTPYKEVLKQYILLDSQTSDELRNALWGQTSRDISNEEDAPPFDYKPLREKPILRTNDGRAIILDSLLYSERATVGPVFILATLRSKGKSNEIFGAFGKAFEDYVCSILERMFPDISGVRNKRLQCRIKRQDQTGKELEIDACLNDVIEAVIFEVKAVWIRENEILTDDHEKYLQYLREKYISGKKDSGDREVVGLGQVARIINLISDQEWIKENQEFSKIKLIYPALVVYDPLLSAPVYSDFLNSEFKALLQPDNQKSWDNQIYVAPLTLLTIEDLEDLEESIKHFGFKELLAAYSKLEPDRLTSLHNFIAFSEYNQQIYSNHNLVDKGMELIDKSRKAVFPKESNESDSESNQS